MWAREIFSVNKTNVKESNNNNTQRKSRTKNTIHFIASCEQLLSLILTHSCRAKKWTHCRARDRRTTNDSMAVYCLLPGLHHFSCYLVFFGSGFGSYFAANHQKASSSSSSVGFAISYGNWPRHIYGTIKILLAPLKINLCAILPHHTVVVLGSGSDGIPHSKRQRYAQRQQNAKNKWHQVRTTNVKCLSIVLLARSAFVTAHVNTSKSDCVFSPLANKLNHNIKCTQISICFYLSALMVLNDYFFSFESHSGHYLPFHIPSDSGQSCVCCFSCGLLSCAWQNKWFFMQDWWFRSVVCHYVDTHGLWQKQASLKCESGRETK